MYFIEYYTMNTLTAKIKVDGLSVSMETFTDNILFLPWGEKVDDLTLDDLDELFADRVFPKERGNCKHILERLDIPFYDPELICRKNHGLLSDDMCWMKFSDTDSPDLCFDDINCFQTDIPFVNHNVNTPPSYFEKEKV